LGGIGRPESSIMTPTSVTPTSELLQRTTLDSPVGQLRLIATETALLAVLWPEEREGRVKFTTEPVDGDNKVLRQTAKQLGEYFAGKRRSFDLPLELRGTEFQQQVWQALAEIPFAETSTYGKQAAAIGRPRAIRAVGSANGRNPLSIVLPCHRIVGADGKLTGFAGGLDTKRWLLDHERMVGAR
jgi:methylated-DNA-[protein]-cysteine S-methyltransferase